MKLFPIVFLLAVAAGEALGEICNSQKTTTKLIARRTWPGPTSTTTAKPTTVTTTSSPVSTTTMATTTALPILFNCSVSRLYGGSEVCNNMCGHATSTTTGVVQSPNFPGDYGNYDGECVVTITVPAEWMIRLIQFTTYNLETGKADVEVYNDLISVLMVPEIGNTVPVITTTNTLSIDFRFFASSKPSTAIYNWQATFSVTSQGSSCFLNNPACGTMCTNVTSAGTGVVQSPNFPDDYGNNYKECIVSIVVPAGKKIRLAFTAFNLETGKGYLSVGERGKVHFSGLSGSTIPAVITTAANTVYFLFNSKVSTKPSTARYNWQATYTAV